MFAHVRCPSYRSSQPACSYNKQWEAALLLWQCQNYFRICSVFRHNFIDA